MKDFIAISETPVELLRHYLDVAHRLKRQYLSNGRNDPVLAGRTLAMIFEKPSLRTRASFAVAMTHLGGSGLVLRPDEVGLGTREPIEDVARGRGWAGPAPRGGGGGPARADRGCRPGALGHVRWDHGPHVRARKGDGT